MVRKQRTVFRVCIVPVLVFYLPEIEIVHDFADGDSDLSAVRRSAQPGVMQSLAQPGIMQSLAQPGIMQSLTDFEPEPEGAGGRAQQRGSRWGPREVELLGKNCYLSVRRTFLAKM